MALLSSKVSLRIVNGGEWSIFHYPEGAYNRTLTIPSLGRQWGYLHPAKSTMKNVVVALAVALTVIANPLPLVINTPWVIDDPGVVISELTWFGHSCQGGNCSMSTGPPDLGGREGSLSTRKLYAACVPSYWRLRTYCIWYLFRSESRTFYCVLVPT